MNHAYKSRIADAVLADKLSYMGAVLVRGPKWCGKTTTCEQVAKSAIYMDDPELMAQNQDYAAINVKDLLRGDRPRLIDEWQLAPQSRKVVAIPEAVFALANTDREPVLGGEPFAKLRWECRAESPDELVFRARRGDIDLNGHVNNVHYVEWLMEGRPDSAGPCRELDVVFKSETLAGEEVRVESIEVEPGVFIHRVYAPDGRDHVLARTGVVRTQARLAGQ